MLQNPGVQELLLNPVGFGSFITGIPDALQMVDDFDDIFDDPKNFSGVDQFRKSSKRTF